MAWFDKALKTVQGTAEKAAFEADKLVRVKREESTLADMQRKVQGKLVDLGQAALALYRSGALTDPAVSGLAQELADLEGQVDQQKEKLEAIRLEQYQAGGQAAAEVEAAAPVSKVEAPLPAATPALVVCPNCQSEVKATVTFCPECGNKLK